ncbi:MAG: hypothetical protein Q8S05_02650 [Sulfuricella sp.]|nr:hypothetical protein [Sulfuricella sp.]
MKQSEIGVKLPDSATLHPGYNWASLQRNGMKRDSSWKKSAEDYLALYKAVLSPESNNHRAAIPRTQDFPLKTQD